MEDFHPKNQDECPWITFCFFFYVDYFFVGGLPFVFSPSAFCLVVIFFATATNSKMAQAVSGKIRRKANWSKGATWSKNNESPEELRLWRRETKGKEGERGERGIWAIEGNEEGMGW